MKKLILILIFISGLFFADKVGATTYYVDFVNGTDVNDGLATSTPWVSLDKFAENARSPGDKLIVRRGMASTTGMSSLTPTSDGRRNNPIIIESDYDNLWNDFASSTQTATMTIGIKTITMSASTTGIVVGNWIFVDGENSRDYAYEVRDVTGSTITLYLPFKGDASGTGYTLNIMPYNPIRGTTALAGTWTFSEDHWWKIQGLEILTSGDVIAFSKSIGEFKDLILNNSGSSNSIFELLGSYTSIMNISKVRMGPGFGAVLEPNITEAKFLKIIMKNCYIETSAPTTNFLRAAGSLTLEECEIIKSGSALEIVFEADTNISYELTFRNVSILASTTFEANLVNTNINYNVYNFEDYNGNIGDNRIFNLYFASSTQMNLNNLPIIQNSTTTVRSGGGNSTILTIPTSSLSSNFEFSKYKLFEYPIYADTTSKIYTVYFMSTSTSEWIANPANDELWIEAEYWASPTGNSKPHRKLTKSTGVVDFVGSTAWQSLAITIQPTENGILYLRSFYAKDKEMGKTNWFFTDIQQTIQ